MQLFFAAFLFLITIYTFTSMIKTEMVVQKRPEKISLYEELLVEPGIKSIQPEHLNDHWDFINSHRNTAEGYE